MHPYNRRQVRNNREIFVIIVMAYYSLNLLLMKKKSYIMFAGIIAFLLCWSSAMMAQNNSQRESSLRDALSARQGGMAMGSTLKMPVAQRPSTDNMLLQTVASPLQKPLAAPLLKTPGGIVLWGNVIHQEGWKVGNAAYGMYSVGTTVPIEVKPLGLMNYMEVNAGSGIVGDVFHAMYLDLLAYSEGQIKVHHYTYDIDTWEQLSDDNLGRDGLSLCAMETAQDRNTGKIYGVFWDESGTNLQWGTIDYTKMKRNFIGWAERQYVALGISKEGTLYGISLDGNLYSISTTDGKETLVGSTGVTVRDSDGSYYQQSGEIDQKTNIFYWASIDKDGKSVLYNVDLTTGRANKIGDMPSETQILALTIPTTTAAPEAPARINNLKFVFEKGNTTGRIQFTAPSKKINGEPLTGNLTYYVVANNDTVKKAVATAGAKVDDEITVSGGDTKFLVTIANAAGSSPKVRYTAWVGYDIPADIERVKFNYDGTKAVVTWHSVTQGKHGGYVGEVIYDVKRMPDGAQVQTNVAGNSLTVPFTTTELKKYSFAITPKAGNRQGNEVASNGIVIGKAIVPPFKESFYDEESFNNFTAIDANDDGQTWEWGLADDWKGRAQSGYNPKGVADDWLLSPPFELKADRLYTVSFEAYNTLAEQFKEVFQLACGEGYNPVNYAKVGQPVLVPKAQTKFTYELKVPKDGSYHLAIHDKSGFNQWRFYVRNFQLVPGALFTAPDAATDFHVIVDQTGREKATLNFKMPVKAVNGDALTAQLDSAVIYRDDVKLGVLKNPMSGQVMTYKDDNVAKGAHIYKVVAYNAAGAGREAVAKAFVGFDIPATPTGLKALDKNTVAALSWDKTSTVGANGGVVVPEEITYYVMSMKNSKEPTDTLASFKNKNSYDVTPVDLNTGEQQHFVYWGVSAQNQLGSSGIATTRLIAGKAYNVPFKESFANASLSSLVWLADTKGTSWKIRRGVAYDKDGGALCFEPAHTGDESTLGTGKISLIGTTNPKLIFSYGRKNFPDTKLIVFVQRQDGTRTELKTIDYSLINGNDAWFNEVIPLSGFENERFVFIGFKAVSGTNHEPIFVDNIRIMEVQRHNLSINVSGTSKVVKGRTAKLQVKVENIGECEAKNFTVRLKSGGKEINSYEWNDKLAPFSSCTLDFQVPSSAIIADAKEMKVIAEVEYDKDLDNTDNKAETTIRLEDSEKPTIQNLRGTREQSNVSLEWEAPNTAPQTVTEDFERYDAWSTEFGDWTLIDANGGYSGGFFDDLWYPNQFTQFAYIIFNPFVLGENVPTLNPWLKPFSGQQYASVPYELDETGQSYVNSDNWIISPKLSGQAQTISFYVHNMTVNNVAYIENYDVLYSSAGNDITDFTNIVLKNRQAVSGEWEKVTINVPAGTTYFAIHQTTPQTGLMFGIDDVTYTKETPTPIYYGIYKAGALINKVPVTVRHCVDVNAGANTQYAVTAIYADGTESAPVEVNVPTGIENIITDGKPVDVYTVDGKLVRRHTTTLRGLRKGVYVVGNKKILIE